MLQSRSRTTSPPRSGSAWAASRHSRCSSSSTRDQVSTPHSSTIDRAQEPPTDQPVFPVRRGSRARSHRRHRRAQVRPRRWIVPRWHRRQRLDASSGRCQLRGTTTDRVAARDLTDLRPRWLAVTLQFESLARSRNQSHNCTGRASPSKQFMSSCGDSAVGLPAAARRQLPLAQGALGAEIKTRAADGEADPRRTRSCGDVIVPAGSRSRTGGAWCCSACGDDARTAVRTAPPDDPCPPFAHRAGRAHRSHTHDRTGLGLELHTPLSPTTPIDASHTTLQTCQVPRWIRTCSSL